MPLGHREIRTCRVCDGTSFTSVVSLGTTPLANALVDPRAASSPDVRYPLEAVRCEDCALVQLSVVVDPAVMFRQYLYATSASAPMVGHFRAYADAIVARFAPPGSLAVEIGSNDGVLLAPLLACGVRVVGIEPAANLAAHANAAGLETWNEFFSPNAARRVAARHGRASVVLANNVLAHIDDLAAVMDGLDTLLDERGVFIAEVPYLADLLQHVEYDTIYHEHLSYFAVLPLVRLFDRAGLELFDVQRVSVHGGSLRVFAARPGAYGRRESVDRLTAAELALGLGGPRPYQAFAQGVVRSRESLRSLLRSARAQARRVAALGATAKGNTLLNFCELGSDDISWIADSTPAKQGLLAPGSRIPIRGEFTILEERPDLTLLLAWNYADAIVERFERYTAAGGRFIHPIPVARVLEP